MRAALPVVAVLLLSAVPAAADPAEDGLLVQKGTVVSGPTPYGPCSAAGRGREASPALASGQRPEEPLVVWQQDAGHDAFVDIDTSSAGLGSTAGDLGVGPCAPGGAADQSVSAPSVATGPDGSRWTATTVSGFERGQVVLARLRPGGSWQRTVVHELAPGVPPLLLLATTVVVDPVDPETVHVAYVRNHVPAGTVAVHRVSSDGGATWSPESIMSVGPTPLGFDFAEQLVALGGARLLALSTEVDQVGMVGLTSDYVQRGDLTQAPIVVRARTSDDSGRTWSLPRPVLVLRNGGVRDREEGGTALRSLVRPSVAVGPDGAVHVAGESVAADGSETLVLVARSTDGGLSWATPRAIEVDGLALCTAVAVDGSGRVAVSWLGVDQHTMQAAWSVAATRRGGAWTSAQPLSETFDLRALAPAYVGDQGALLGLRKGFAAATVVGTGDEANPSDVVLTTLR